MTVCEGRLLESRFGWTLLGGYPTLSPVDRAVANQQKVQAVLRALHLMGSAQAAGWTAQNLQFGRGEAPTVVAGSDPELAYTGVCPILSLAHSGGLLLVAAGTGAETGSGSDLRVGADVERLRARDFQRLEAHMGWSEAASLWPHKKGEAPEQLLFYRRWTLAESLYKALGKVNLECFNELEPLAVNGLWFVDGETSTGSWDSGWLGKVIGRRHWFVRWWRVTHEAQPAIACLLRSSRL